MDTSCGDYAISRDACGEQRSEQRRKSVHAFEKGDFELCRHRRRGADGFEEKGSRSGRARADQIRSKREATGTVQVESTTPTATPAPALPSEPEETERQRLARLSQENKAAAQSILRANSPASEAPVVISEATSTVTAAASTVEAVTELPQEPVAPEVPESVSAGTQNVFKQIAVKSPGRTTGQRRKGSREKKGGGRQKQVKKLNRQKYLEYKYAARDMLADPGVAEEHRSNLLGQIWAKGERISFEAAIEYIEQKEAEGILPPTVAAELHRLIRRMETRR